jgi:hypothetical protein
MQWDIFATAHGARFGRRVFGRDVQLAFAFGAVVLAQGNGHPANAKRVSHDMGIPRETARRYLGELVRRGMLHRRDCNYSPIKIVGIAHDKLVAW